MEIRIYKPPDLTERKYTPIAITFDAHSISVTENFYTFGNFEVKIASAAAAAGKFQKYLYVLIDGKFWGLITGIEKAIDAQGDITTITGLDLKGLTSARYTTPPGFTYEEVGGIAGFDAITGSTETCMKHYVRNNFFQPSSPTRQIPGFEIAPDLGRGLENDRYMTRFDLLSGVLEELGTAAQVGYTVLPELETGKLIFDICEGVDRTANQSDNPRVIFSVSRKNIENMNYVDSDRNLRNLFYASLSGGQFVDDIYTATITRDDGDYPSGIYRWEQHLDISATHPEPGREFEELKRLALARADSYTTVRSLNGAIMQSSQKYGIDFKLGDYVSVVNEDWGVRMNTQITSIRVDADVSGVRHSATFGNSALTIIQRLRRDIRNGG
ncbi:MAG: siphovirus ReqiPepy6 Gp37-like family protein [Oscillospiraceae bacterium]|nr:siphovirus ReqiPepy6 Gp37-like family protein [Oscillospiraceae bacterium]